MNPYLQLLKERYDEVPVDLQELISSEEYKKNIFDICKDNKLTIEQMGILEQETTLVLLGITSANNYNSELKDSLKIEGELLNTIIKSVNEKVFEPVRESLSGIAEDLNNEESTIIEVKKINNDQVNKEVQQSREEIVEKREDLLAHIENPPAGGGLNLAMLKMTKPVVGEINKSANVNMNNLSTPGNNPPISTPPKSSDPYREMPE